MAFELSIYSTITEPLPGQLLAQLADGAACTPRRDAQGRQCYDLKYKNLSVAVQHVHAEQPEFVGLIRRFLGHVLHLAEGNMDNDLWEIYYRVSKVRQGLDLTIEPDWDDEVSPRLVTALAEAVCGFIEANDALTDPWGTVLLGPGNERGPGVKFVFDSAKERRTRSNGQLATLGLTTPDWLPVTVADEEALLRAPADVARRAIVLMSVAMRAEGTPQAKVVKFLQQRGVAGAVSPEERTFLNQAQPDESLKRQLTWRYESLWTLLWALGHIDALGSPSEQCDAKRSVKVINEMPAQRFVNQARLRPAAEILDAVDFYYRAHWHVRRVQLDERPAMDDLDNDVVEERHHVLNWLTNYRYQEWDEVTTDT